MAQPNVTAARFKTVSFILIRRPRKTSEITELENVQNEYSQLHNYRIFLSLASAEDLSQVPNDNRTFELDDGSSRAQKSLG